MIAPDMFDDLNIPKIKIYVTERVSKLKRLLRIIGLLEYISGYWGLEKKEEGFYQIKGKSKKEVILDSTKCAQFTEIVDNLLLSDFAFCMPFTIEKMAAFTEDLTYHIYGMLYDYKIRFSCGNVSINYNGLRDTVDLAALSRPNERAKLITQDNLDEAMNKSFPIDVFSPYHKKLIMGCENLEKPFVFEDSYQPVLSGNFILHDETDCLILKRKNQN